MKFNTIEEAIEDIKKGRWSFLSTTRTGERGRPDHGGREGHAGGHQFYGHARKGLICLSLTPERVEHLQLP